MSHPLFQDFMQFHRLSQDSKSFNLAMLIPEREFEHICENYGLSDETLHETTYYIGKTVKT